MVTVLIPTEWQTDRQDIHSAIIAMLKAFQTAMPGIVTQVRHARPPGMSDFPLVYIGGIDEDVAHSGGSIAASDGLRRSVFNGSIVYVDTLTDSQETDDRVNVFLDYMRDLFTVNARILPSGIFQYAGTRSVADDELPEAALTVTGTAIHWQFTTLRGDPVHS